MIKTYIPASVVKPDIFSCPLLALALGFRPVVRPYTGVRVRRTQVRLPRPLQGPDHVQLTLLNWDTESVLTLNKTS